MTSNQLNLFRYCMLVMLVSLVTACFDISETKLTHQFKDDVLSISDSQRSIQLSALSSGAIKVEFLENNKTQLKSFAVKPTLSNEPAELTESEKEYVFRTKGIIAKINKSNFQIDFYRGEEFLTSQQPVWLFGDKSDKSNKSDKNHEQSVNFTKVEFSLAEGEKIMGGGQRVLGMDRRGHRMPLYNRAHYGYTTESNQMYYSLPLVISNKKYSLLFDNTASGFLDIGKTKNDRLTFEADSGRRAYIIFSDQNYPQLINQYVNVTGKQPMPPRWAFGNFSSRFGYKNQQQVLDTIELFKQEDMPVDAIILDLYWFGNDIKGFMGNLAWDKEAFPEPEKMIDELKSKGVKTILVTEPFILSTSDRWAEAVEQKILMKNQQGEPKRFDFYFGNTGLIDIFDDKAKTWFSNIYSDLTKQGVAGVWGDLGEPEVHPDDGIHYVSEMHQSFNGKTLHNAYGHEWAKTVYQNLITDQPNKRPFVMMRSGFAGSQRFAMIPWTGDVSRSWDGLKPQVELTLQMGMQGLAYTHSDLGGFAGGETFDQELYIRWLQYGVFQPVFRPHAQDNIAPEPVFHDQQTKDIVRKFLKLRYSMLPYLYTMAYQNSTTGMPMMRPLMFSELADSSAFDIKDRYLWGDALLVAPIVEPGLKESKVTLPSGVWFNFWNGQKYTGDQTVSISVTLETIPVFAKAGSFIPMVEPVNNTKDYSSEKLTLHYYHDPSMTQSRYQMYEDDGVTRNNIEKGDFELLNFEAKSQNNQLTISFDRAGKGYDSMPAKRDMQMVVHAVNPIKKIMFGETQLDATQYCYDSERQQVEIDFVWDHKAAEVVILFEALK